MDKIFKNDIRSIIRILQDVVERYPDEHIPVSVNLYNDKVLALQSICLDNDDTGLGIQLFFEADRDNSIPQTEEFQFYTQGEELY